MSCPHCGADIDATTGRCLTCEAALDSAREAVHASPQTPPQSILESGNNLADLEEAKALGWNWGGFLMPYLWLIGHGRVGNGLLLLVSMGLPMAGLLHLFVYPAMAVYLGLTGYETAWKHRAYHSVMQLQETEREWTRWGVVANVLLVVGFIFFMVYMRTFFMEAWKEMESMGL